MLQPVTTCTVDQTEVGSRHLYLHLSRGEKLQEYVLVSVPCLGHVVSKLSGVPSAET